MTKRDGRMAAVHDLLGCRRCRFADARAWSRGIPCCQYAGLPDQDSKTFRCTTRRETELLRHWDKVEAETDGTK